MGLKYGLAFINLFDIHNRDGQSVCTMQVPNIQARTLDGSNRPSVIHPGVLDAVLAFAAVKGNKTDLTAQNAKQYFADFVK